MSIKILILDDEIYRVETLKNSLPNRVVVDHVISRTAFYMAIKDNKYDVIMLDHDLGWDSDNHGWNGQGAAEILTKNRTYLGDDQLVVIHSMNSIGAANMLSVMQSSDHLNVYVIPGAWAKIKFFDDKLLFSN